jgi:transposase, IS5 family
MNEQTSFAGLAWTTKGKLTRRERFLAEMDQVIPWQRLITLIQPHYAKPGRGRRPLGLEKMLRIYFLQHWFDLSDPAAEDAIYDSESMRRFVGVELGEDTIPDESTILRFRHLLEEHQLTKAIFEEIGSLLEEKGLLLKQGTIVDATIIAAPSSTKNRSGRRDPEMRQTRKGNTWHFGMKVHVGTDKQGLVHSLTTTDAAQPDIKELRNLLHGEERELWIRWPRGVATVTLSRPERKNPLTFESYAELRDTFRQLQLRDRREGGRCSPARAGTSAPAATCTRSSARSSDARGEADGRAARPSRA